MIIRNLIVRLVDFPIRRFFWKASSPMSGRKLDLLCQTVTPAGLTAGEQEFAAPDRRRLVVEHAPGLPKLVR